MRASGDPLLKTVGLKVEYSTRHGTVRAVRGVDIELQSGHRLGLVGESGSGKSTTAWALLRLVNWPGRIVGGQVLFRGEDLLAKTERQLRRIRGADISLITQSARAGLNPLVKIGVQISNVYRAHRTVTRAETRHHVIDMLARVALADPERVCDSYPHELSGGMAQRVIIALALICSPELIIADEPTTGLDLTIQAQILDLIKDTVSRNGMSAIIVTHDLGIVARYCESVAVMYGGELLEVGAVTSFFQGPVHPYGIALLASSSLSHSSTRARAAKPFVRDSAADGCAYYGVCPLARPVCQSERPTLARVHGDHLVRCHRSSELLDLTAAERLALVDDAGRIVRGA